jgi:hypothetical protein
MRKNFLKDSNQKPKDSIKIKRNFNLLFEFAKNPESKK